MYSELPPPGFRETMLHLHSTLTTNERIVRAFVDHLPIPIISEYLKPKVTLNADELKQECYMTLLNDPCFVTFIDIMIQMDNNVVKSQKPEQQPPIVFSICAAGLPNAVLYNSQAQMCCNALGLFEASMEHEITHDALIDDLDANTLTAQEFDISEASFSPTSLMQHNHHIANFCEQECIPRGRLCNRLLDALNYDDDDADDDVDADFLMCTSSSDETNRCDFVRAVEWMMNGKQVLCFYEGLMFLIKEFGLDARVEGLGTLLLGVVERATVINTVVESFEHNGFSFEKTIIRTLKDCGITWCTEVAFTSVRLKKACGAKLFLNVATAEDVSKIDALLHNNDFHLQWKKFLSYRSDLLPSSSGRDELTAILMLENESRMSEFFPFVIVTPSQSIPINMQFPIYTEDDALHVIEHYELCLPTDAQYIDKILQDDLFCSSLSSLQSPNVIRFSELFTNVSYRVMRVEKETPQKWANDVIVHCL